MRCSLFDFYFSTSLACIFLAWIRNFVVSGILMMSVFQCTVGKIQFPFHKIVSPSYGISWRNLKGISNGKSVLKFAWPYQRNSFKTWSLTFESKQHFLVSLLNTDHLLWPGSRLSDQPVLVAFAPKTKIHSWRFFISYFGRILSIFWSFCRFGHSLFKLLSLKSHFVTFFCWTPISVLFFLTNLPTFDLNISTIFSLIT